MKVVAINGSPKKDGNTALAIKTVLKELENNGIKTEIIDIGAKAIHGCIACYKCKSTGKCVFDDGVNEVAEKIAEADGVIIGSPTYFAGVSGTLKCYLDRLFMVGAKNFKYKVGAGVVAVRRGGALPVFEQINKYFSICEMVSIGGNYWNMAFGRTEGECEQDLEGMQNMRMLGRNMAWLIKTIKDSKVDRPASETKIMTNMIR